MTRSTPIRHLRAATLLVALFALSSCKAADPTSSSGLSQSDVEALASELAGGLANGAGTAHALRPSGTRAGISNLLVNVGINSSVNCTAGGTLHITGSVSGSVNDQTGFGTLSIGMTETLTDWNCITGFVMNGDPDLTAAGTVSLPSGNGQMSFGGGIRWTGNGGGSCTMQLTILTYSNGTGHASGTICGHQIDITT